MARSRQKQFEGAIITDNIEKLREPCSNDPPIGVNQPGIYGYYPLALAAYYDSNQAALFLMSKGALLDQVDTEGRSALTVALSSKSGKVARSLINGGANLTIANNQGVLPLQLAKSSRLHDVVDLIKSKLKLEKIPKVLPRPSASSSLSSSLANSTTAKILESQTPNGPLLERENQSKNCSPLKMPNAPQLEEEFEKVIRKNNAEKLRQWLSINDPINVNEPITQFWMPLGFAIAGGFENTAQVLIDNGASLNKVTTADHSALPIAQDSSSYRQKMTQFLARNGVEDTQTKVPKVLPNPRASLPKGTIAPLTTIPTSTTLAALKTTTPLRTIPKSTPPATLKTTTPLITIPTSTPLAALKTSTPLTTVPPSTTPKKTPKPKNTQATVLKTTTPLTTIPTSTPLAALKTSTPLRTVPPSTTEITLETTKPSITIPKSTTPTALETTTPLTAAPTLTASTVLGGVALLSTVVTPLISNVTRSRNSLAILVNQTVQYIAGSDGNEDAVPTNKTLLTVMSQLTPFWQEGEGNYTGSVTDDYTTVNQTVQPTVNSADDISNPIVAMVTVAGIVTGIAAGIAVGIEAGRAIYRFCWQGQPQGTGNREHDVELELLRYSVNSSLIHEK